MPYGESDTRAKLIDPAIHACGWTEDLIRREETAGAIEMIDGKPGQLPTCNSAKYVTRANRRSRECQSSEVLADQFGHLEHRDGFLAAENGLKIVIGVDVGFLFLVLEPILFMYAQSFFVISVRGIALLPTTALRAASGCTGFMNAGLGLRFFFAAAMLRLLQVQKVVMYNLEHCIYGFLFRL